MFSDKMKRVICFILAGIMVLSVGSVLVTVIF